MPNLYMQQTRASSQGQVSAPQPVANSGAVGDGLARAASGLADVANGEAHIAREQASDLRRQQDENDRVWAGDAVADFLAKQQTRFMDMQSRAEGAAPGFTQEFQKGFNEMAEGVTQLAAPGNARKYLQQHIQSARMQMTAQAIDFETKATQRWRTSTFEQGVEKWVNVVANQPEQAGTALRAIEETAPEVGPDRERYVDAAKKRVTQIAASTAIARDPARSFSILSASLGIELPKPPDPVKLMSHLTDQPRGFQRLVNAVMGQESNGGKVDTSQPNYAGARGPMQVTEATFNGLKKQGLIPAEYDWSNPDHSTEAGIALLKDLSRKFPGDDRKVLAAYYAGERVVNADGTVNTGWRDLKNPKAPTVGQYVDQVMSRMGVGNTEPAPLAALESVAIRSDAGPVGIDWVDAMKPEDRLQAWSQARTEMQRNATQARQGLERAERNLEAVALAGKVPTDAEIPTLQQYVDSFGQIEGRLRFGEVMNTVSLGRIIGQVRVASPLERASIVSASEPAVGDPLYADKRRRQQQVVQAVRLVERQLENDPMAYVRDASPRVAAAEATARSLPSNATPEQRRAAADGFANVALAEQTRLGAPVPQLLTDQQAAKIAMQFHDIKEGGANAAALMETLQQTWGGNFPVVFQQLQKDGKLPGDAVIIPGMKDAASKERLARLAGLKDEDLKRLLPSGAYKDITETVYSAMAPLRDTLMESGGDRTFRVAHSAVERLSMHYVSSGKGVKDAVRQAYDEVAGHGYQFESTYRIPNKEAPEQITQGVQALRYKVEELPIMVPPGPPGIKPDEYRRQYLAGVRSNAVFVTNPDETGVLMYARSASGLLQVLGPDGRQMSFTWKQLRDEAAAAEAIKAVQVGGR